MEIFKRLFGKKLSEKALYWKEHPIELKEKEEIGRGKLSKLEEYNSALDSLSDLSAIINCRNKCEYILNWFQDLENEECPYHINNGVIPYRENVLIRVNEAIVRIHKLNSNDFIACRDAIVKDVSNTEKTLQLLCEQTNRGFFIGYSDTWVSIVKRIFNENRALSFLDVYVECGLPKEIAFSKDSELISSYLPITKGNSEYDIFRTYQMAISDRYDLINRKLPLYEMSPESYNLNINNNEKILYVIYSVILYEEKVIQRNISYSGVKWSNGLLRAGNLSLIGNEIKDFAPQDAGKIFITSKRIIFIGKQKNITKSISINNIITYNLYRDGVLLNQSNKKAILFKFDNFVDFGIFQIQDGLNQFVIILDRILNDSIDKSNI